MDDLVWITDPVVDDGPYGLEGLDIAIDALFGVIGLGGDGWSEVSLQIEGDDLAFVGNGSREIMDIASGWQDLAG